MRTLNATLLAAMDTGNYDPYFLATIQDNYNGNVYLSAMPTGYELSDLELVLTVQMPAFMDVPFYRTSIVLTRGVTIAGLHYTLSTSKFTIINSTWDGNFQTFKCHLIPRVHYSAAGDLTYKQVIDAFCLTYGKTAVYLDPAASWLSYQFLPTGKMVILNNAQTLFQQLKQKYFIFACDNGSDQILFYTAFTHVASPQYSITGYRFSVDYNVDQRRQYIWRDENETLHRTAPSFAFVAHPDVSVETIMSLLDLGSGVVLAGSQKVAAHGGKIFRSTDYGLTWDAGYDLSVINDNYVGVYSLLHLGNGIVLAAGFYGGFILRSTDYGVTWIEVATLGTDTSQSLTDCGNGIVLVGHNSPSGSPGCQIYKSVDYGLTWALAQALGTEAAVYSILYLGSGVCLAGTSNLGRVYRSTNYGSTWSLVQRLGTETGVYSLLGLGGGIVLAGTCNHAMIYKSTDSGQTWSLVTTLVVQVVYTLDTLGGGVVIAGTGGTGKVFRSTDFGATWALVQALGTEVSVRSFLTLCNGSTLAGTDNHAMIYKSLNCAADLDIIHNLGFMPSTAAEPSAYFLLAQPKFDPFPVHLKYQSSDYIRVNMMQVGDNGVAPTYDFTCAQVTEILDLKSVKTFNKQFQGKTTPMSFYLLIGQTEWLSNTAAGPLPGTIERVGSYTPLVTASFDDILSSNDNNLQAAMDTLDDHTHGSQIAGSTEKTVLVDADQFPLVDSETTTHVLKYTLWSNIKSKIFAVLGIQIDAATRMTSPLDTDLVTMVDENTSGKLVKGMTWANLKARFLTYLATQIITLSGLNVGSATGAGAGCINMSGGQLGFPVTQNASADANTLDDYEEGEWTFDLYFSGAKVGITYDANYSKGHYTKIGRIVHCVGYMILTSIGSSVGLASLYGLPFNSSNTYGGGFSVANIMLSGGITYVGQMVAYTTKNDSRIILAQVSEAGVWSYLTNANFTNNASMVIELTYEV